MSGVTTGYLKGKKLPGFDLVEYPGIV
jgi:hypothetical protein